MDNIDMVSLTMFNSLAISIIGPYLVVTHFEPPIAKHGR
jgi:hypothetical protein